MTTAVDLRPILLPVGDQGHRGTCLAFAVTVLHEVVLAGGIPGGEDLAEEALYWGCKQVDRNWSSGTSFQSASAALPRWGQPIETAWPYDPRRPEGTAYDPPATGSAVWYRAGLRSEASTSTNVRALLADNSPVALGITVYPSFYRPSSTGHITDPQPGETKKGRHAVVAVGFDAGSILVRNSWGLLWGLSGYGWLSNAYVDDHATDAWTVAVTPTAQTPSSATPSQSEERSYGTT
jgi:C1A family cysteine protease